MPTTRSVFATAVLASAALTLTACGPSHSNSSHSSRSHAAKKAGKKTNSKRSKKRKSNGSCPTTTNGRKVIWVNNVEGAMNNIVAQNTKRRCNPNSNQGAAYQPIGAPHTYSVASGNAKVTIISKKDSTQRALTAQTGGIAHVKTCADPKGKQYDSGQTKVDASDCWGLNFYEVRLDSNGKITEMTEIYAS